MQVSNKRPDLATAIPVAGILAAVGVAIDILTIILMLSGKNDDLAQKLCKDIIDRLEALRKAQEHLAKEMRNLFAENKQFLIQLYLQSMNTEIKGFLITLGERIEEIPHFDSKQGREENREGFLALRNAGDPLIYKITSTGPAAFQGIVLGYGVLRSIFEALQRTAPDRQIRLEYRKSEATALSNFSREVAVFTADKGDDAVPAQIAQIREAITEKRTLSETINKRPETREKTETFPVTKGNQNCTRVVVYKWVYTITGSVKDGWNDSSELVTVRDEVVDCQNREERGGGPRDRWLTAGDVPEDGEFDVEDNPTATVLPTTLEKYHSKLSRERNLLAASHENTLRLNQLSEEIGGLEAQETALEAILSALQATIEAIAVRQRELPRV